MEHFKILFSITMVNLLLSGDNALVIALASRRLPPRQQKAAFLWGGGGAVVLRIVLTFAAVVLLKVPYLQLLGGLLLQWVALKLITEDHAAAGQVPEAGSLLDAIKTILVADLIMSLDNVVAIAAVARGDTVMLIVGLAISIPIIIWGSRLISMLMARWPLIIIIGAAFLGYTAGEMVLADKKIAPLTANYPWALWVVPGLFALAVIVVAMLTRHGGLRQSGE